MNAQTIFLALQAQRNAALDEVAHACGTIADLKARIVELEGTITEQAAELEKAKATIAELEAYLAVIVPAGPLVE